MTVKEEEQILERVLDPDRVEQSEMLAIGIISDEIVQRAEKLARSYRNPLSREDASPSPFKAALAIASRPDSGKKAVQNYILSQLGRRGAAEIWRSKGDKPEFFATALSKQLDELETLVTKAHEAMTRQLGSDPGQDRLAQTRMRIIRQFIGYLARAHLTIAGKTRH